MVSRGQTAFSMWWLNYKEKRKKRSAKARLSFINLIQTSHCITNLIVYYMCKHTLIIIIILFRSFFQ